MNEVLAYMFLEDFGQPQRDMVEQDKVLVNLFHVADVRHDRQIVFTAKQTDNDEFRDAAKTGAIGLDKSGSPGLHEILEQHTMRYVFAHGQRDGRDGPSQSLVPQHIVGVRRFFDPIGRHGLQLKPDADGGRQGPLLERYAGLPLGGLKYRMHQLSSAMGLVQLKYYDEQMAEIRRAINYFWDLLKGVPGLQAYRVDESSGINMAGWYAAHGFYHAEELGGLSLARFCMAVVAEGGICHTGANAPLHQHPALTDINIYDGELTSARSSLPVSEAFNSKVYFIPWFNRFDQRIIEEQANAYRKVAENYQDLLNGDTDAGVIHGSASSKSSLKT